MIGDYSGVYVIENAINGKKYIGSTVNLRERRQNHFRLLRRGKHDNGQLQMAFNLYGENAFVFKHMIICYKNLRLQDEKE